MVFILFYMLLLSTWLGSIMILEVTVVFQDGQTFLMIACQLDNCQIVKRLLEESSIDVNAVDNV